MYNKNYFFGGAEGLVAFQQRFVKLCIEDKQFFDENWENINPNDYSDCDCRYLLALLKDFKRNNVEITYDKLKIFINSKIEGFQKIIYCETLDALHNDITLEDDDVVKIKETFMYFGLFATMVTEANHILDWAKSGFKYGKEILNQCEKLFVGEERLKAQRERLLTILEVKENVKKGENDWS